MKVTLKIKKDNTVESVQHEIEEINIGQLQDAIRVIKDVFTLVQEDKSLKQLFEEMFDTVAAGEENEEEANTRFFKTLIGAFEVLMVELPDQAFKLLAVMSGVELKTLKQQKVMDAFEVYDAVIEVNDINKLVNRAKKSLAVTKAKVNFTNLLSRAKEKAKLQQ